MNISADISNHYFSYKNLPLSAVNTGHINDKVCGVLGQTFSPSFPLVIFIPYTVKD